MTEPVEASRIVRFSVFEFDAEAGELRRHGMKLRLAGQPIQILAMLVERKGRVVTREELRTRLWPADTFVEFEHSLNAAVMRLRHALGDDADTPRFIQTVPRRGYRFLADLNASADSTFDPHEFVEGFSSAVTPVADAIGLRTAGSAAVLTRKHTPKIRVIGLLVCAFIALGIAGFFGWRKARSSGTITSLAVLPLTNFSADPQQEFFADSMTEELTADLSKIWALRVISRTSVMHYKGTKKTLPEIARELNVDAVIEGSVQRHGDRVRIGVRLVKAADERHLWSETYEREMKDILALRADVARDIADQVRAKLATPVAPRIGWGGTNDPRAYEAFLRGRHFFRRFDAANAARSMEQAVAFDPNYALAYAELAEAYATIEFAGGGADIRAKRDAAGGRACALESDLPECHMFLGDRAMFREWDWHTSVSEFRRAVELAPGAELVRIHYATALFVLGRYESAVSEMRKAVELDPLSPNVLYMHGMLLERFGRYDEAREQFEKILELDPGFRLAYGRLGRCYEFLGQPEKAFAVYFNGAGLKGVPPEDMLELKKAFSSGGFRAFRQLQLRKELASAERNHAPAYNLAILQVQLGHGDQAIRLLQKAYDEHLERLVWLKSSPDWDPLRSNPRFQELVRRMKFPD